MRTWHRKPLLHEQGEYILWHVVEHLRAEYREWRTCDIENALKCIDRLIKEVPADCREAGTSVRPLASLSEDSTRDRGEQPAEGVRLPSTACDWLRNIGVFLDCGDL